MPVGRARGWAGQGRAGQGRAGQGRAGQQEWLGILCRHWKRPLPRVARTNIWPSSRWGSCFAAHAVDGDPVPVPHWGLCLTVEQFHSLAERLKQQGVKFVIEPHLRFKGASPSPHATPRCLAAAHEFAQHRVVMQAPPASSTPCSFWTLRIMPLSSRRSPLPATYLQGTELTTRLGRGRGRLGSLGRVHCGQLLSLESSVNQPGALRLKNNEAASRECSSVYSPQ